MTTKQAMNWMYRFEETVLSMRPELAGKIEWATAEHFYNVGKSVTDAAAQYCANRAPAGPRLDGGLAREVSNSHPSPAVRR